MKGEKGNGKGKIEERRKEKPIRPFAISPFSLLLSPGRSWIGARR
jgi:hypothetical protein